MNDYSSLLKSQGEYVLKVDGVYWYGYQGFMMPAYLPHCTPVISVDTARTVLKSSGRPFVRWNCGFGTDLQTSWWYILKRGPWSAESIGDKKKRWMIRKGKSKFQVRPMTLSEVLEKCPPVAQLAGRRYQGTKDLENRDILLQRVRAAEKNPGVLEYIGCFQGDTLVSYSENHLQCNAVWMAVIRHDPGHLKEYSSYALMDGILDYYLNQKRLEYVLDGSRSIHHRTEFQDHLESVYGFTREYAKLCVVYAPLFGGLVKLLYPFKDCLFGLQKKWTNGTLDNIGAVMQQESIRRQCLTSERA